MPILPPSVVPPSPEPAEPVESTGKPVERVALICALVSLAIGLCVAPFVTMHGDVFDYFLPWARVSRGWFPWAIYVVRPDCNYPPLWLYVLAVVERARLLLGAEPEGGAAVTLLKLPSLLAVLGLTLGSQRFLTSAFGERAARAAAVAVALCAGLWIDAAIWGQADAPLCFFLAAAAWALLRERPTVAGFFAGLALALKLQAAFALPFLLVYAMRRFGPRLTLRAAGAGLVTLGLLTAPFFLYATESGHGLIASYTDAVGASPFRTCGAYNFWDLTVAFDHVVRHLPNRISDSDAVATVGPFSSKQMGIAFFAIAYAWLLARLWRTPQPKMLLLGLGAGYIVFFMLCPEMHERYILPGVVFLAMTVGVSPTARRLYPAWNVLSALNILMQLLFMNATAFYLVSGKGEYHNPLLSFGSVIIAALQTLSLALTLLFLHQESAGQSRGETESASAPFPS